VASNERMFLYTPNPFHGESSGRMLRHMCHGPVQDQCLQRGFSEGDVPR
jgi:hypothetical protein